MLTHLSIRNYALIEELELDFFSGFSVITGETGAGKSILLGALSLLFGARADRNSFRKMNQKCMVEGVFNNNSQVSIDLEKLGIENSETLILRREIAVDGKSRSFINDALVTLQTLKEVSARLVHLNLQKENIRFLSSEFQIDAIDSFAQNEFEKQQYLSCYLSWKQVEQELKKCKNDLAKRIREKEFNQFRWNELDAASLTNVDELVELEAEFKRLDQGAEVLKFLNETEDFFQGDVLGKIFYVSQQSGRFNDFGAEFSDFDARIKALYLEIKDLSQDAGRMLAKVEMDPQRLGEVEQRISLLYRLIQKYQVQTLSDLVEERDRLAQDLIDNDQLELNIQELAKELNLKLKALEEAANSLTQSRKKVIPDFEKKIKELFPLVHLPHAELKVELVELNDFGEDHSGKNQITFWFNANPGMELMPLDQIASGGEMSRLTLVMKTVIAEKNRMPTLIFDEVDAGISGEAALKVGELLRKISKFGQVIAITHLPQIAAISEHHFQVQKIVDDGKTFTSIQQVLGDQRVDATVAMLGGNGDVEALKIYVQQMLRGKKN